jgi:hypothetical protein
MSKIRWRVTGSSLRWALLASVGGLAHACGGKADLEGDEFEGVGARGGRGALGGAAGSTSVSTAGTAGYGAGGYGAGGGDGGYAGTAIAGAAGSGFAGSYNYPNIDLSCDYVVGSNDGWETCNNGIVHRWEKFTCTTSLPRPIGIHPSLYQDYITPGADGGIVLGPEVQCTEDADCTERANGHCEVTTAFPSGAITQCVYGCTSDVECGSNQVCKCENPVGRCVSAQCTTDADCGYGLLCTAHADACGFSVTMSCQTAYDTCRSDQDCGNQACVPHTGYAQGRTCAPIAACPIGRPFLIAGMERLACSVSRADWCNTLGNRAGALSLELSAALATAFTRQALMEHASIAAFARFSLQLLALGAPPELVQAAARAMQDETRHAQACFALASRHAGTAVGPGPLTLDGALADNSWLGVVRDTILEGCIGETVAALEAAEAAAHCLDPDTRRVLLDIAREESQHAELAWRFVTWALAHGPQELRPHVVDVFRSALGSEAGGAVEAPQLSAHQQALLENGVLCEPLRAALRARALSEVVRPCVAAVLQSPAARTPLRPAEFGPALVA